ncbi:hypothetical protein [Chryseobacterium gambrini]|uniref:Uncharacterized protein n=1 Tax=Chryseobacterium gambrini TaxID=373672 RepID=A0A1N7KQW4_9FLAO|nr:hypothetical protein [Chryseobacterium gambrini]SIS63989.1 hypothetical protein SAMN05421785_101672 [Chryseobacterium gambrini]
MDDKILKHLEFVQNTINRMSTNSFLIKGWAITLIGIIFGLNKLEGNYLFEYSDYNFPVEIAIIILIILLFWFTNAYFLQQERRYIYIYSKTIEQFNIPNNNLILDMNYKNYITNSNSNLTDQNRKTITKAILSFCIVGILISLLSFESIFFKIIISTILILVSAFVITYFISVKYLCEFWACLVGRTIVSVYGILLILVLLINHSMFNMGMKKNIENEKCICVIKTNK